MKINNPFWSDDDLEENVTLFEEVPLGRLTLKNRLIRSATWEGLAGPDGSLNEDIYQIYEELAEGGSGAIITGFTSVSDEDDVLEGKMRLSDDSLIPQYQQLTERIHKHGCPVFAQLALGNYIKDGNSVRVDDMTPEDIQDVIRLFADAADRARQSGFDGVQFHAAHLFFLSRFYSRYYNHRKDEYGGTSVKRARILAEVLDAIKDRVPEMTVLVKLNFTDEIEGGVTISDALTAGMLLSEHHIDGIEVSGTDSSRKNIRVPYDEGYFKDFALSLKSVTDVPVILVGGHRTVESMEEILRNESADFFSLSRPLIREPDLPKKWEKDHSCIAQCISCNTCFTRPGCRCVFNR